MTDLEKAARMALEALEYYQIAGLATTRVVDSITALRQAISDSVEQPAQQSAERVEPVAWQWLNTAHFRKKLPKDAEGGAWNPLYIRPPAREWVGLTDDEIGQCLDAADGSMGRLIAAIEAKLKEKNT